ncbi:hypothetical protein GGQ85_002390 [Nitrobacter vulgaris]|uniref:hypothetical protein n=1 Tax=Nitrobacter vulgaris TaxID=29421 RepID=UPI002866431F|nr:hypothetical protein [Nitrobacter vulgaris]MDR6304678.1 hypothetical protein [Nitrobacter vulgaris]
MHEFASDLGEPEFFRTETAAGFRFLNPDHRHFCLVRAARIVSALNAAICLAESGFAQEICVILRTMLEYCTQIDIVLLSRVESSEPIAKIEKYLDVFFADDRRIEGHRAIALEQAFVHDALGARLDEFAEDRLPKPSSKIMSQSYLSLSYYVHGRYPESMDLYGGRPGRFHLNGMRNTPKDKEPIELIETYLDSQRCTTIAAKARFEFGP